MSFDSLGLTPELLRAVADEGYTEPTPVQREAIPLVLAGRDLLAGAQTGTGKTAAFVLPMLQRFAAAQPRGPIRGLVLVPTRELALQVEQAVRTYGARRPLKSVAIYGGVGFDPQVRALRAGPAIVVATPGRLLDHMNQRTIDLTRVEVLVLDEADRMLDMGFIRDIRKILAVLPASRQNLLFSATFSDDIRGLAAGLLDRPATVDVAPRNTAAELVEQVVIRVDRERKTELLSHLVRSGRIDQALVFTRTKHGANRLAEKLVLAGIDAAAIHGNRSQSQRVRALTDFKAGKVAVLVATDIAARGIDIDALPHVVNFEMPMVAEDYVHRIGRTGRAGIDGEAVSLVCVDEAGLLRDIERLLGHPIRAEVVEGFEPDRSIRPEPIRLRSGMGAGMGGMRPGMPRPSAGRPAPSRPARPAPHRSITHRGDPARPAGPGFGSGRPASPPRPGFGAPQPRPAFGGTQPRPAFGSGPRQAPGGHARPLARPPVGLPGERLARSADGVQHERSSNGHRSGTNLNHGRTR